MLTLTLGVRRSRWELAAVCLSIAVALLTFSKIAALLAVVVGVNALRRVCGYQLVVHQQAFLTYWESALISRKEQLISADLILNVFVNEVICWPIQIVYPFSVEDYVFLSLKSHGEHKEKIITLFPTARLELDVLLEIRDRIKKHLGLN